MIKALDLSTEVNYTSKYDTGKEKTVWKLGILDTRIRKMLEDLSWEYKMNPAEPGSGEAKATFNIGNSELEFVAFGLKGFENFVREESGKPIVHKTISKAVNGKSYQVLCPSILDIIPGEVVKELADQIKRVNRVDAEEEKN